jgi:GTPase
MIPVIAIIGRPNVGKSTLFNCLTKSKDALVADFPGVTRDRKYGEGEYDTRRYIVIDTGGMESDAESAIYHLMTRQSLQAMTEANAILFVVDAKEGLTLNDTKIAEKLRQSSKPIFVVVNKSESMDNEIAKADFYQLGFAKVEAISSAHNRGIKKLLGEVLFSFETKMAMADGQEIPPDVIKVAVIGRPNVGKSTLINRVLGEERVLVYDQPGTTRESIFIPFKRGSECYVFIDTAGVRRRTKITEKIEKFSVIKTLQAIDISNIVIFLLNAREGISEQDLRLLDFIIDAGKALVIGINKWDRMSPENRKQVKDEMDRRLNFVAFARTHFISALHGTGIGDLFGSIHEAYASATQKISTSLLTQVLQEAITKHQPPLVQSRRIKLRYAHAGGYNPPMIVIHGNQTEKLPLDYIRYLTNFFSTRLKLIGTPIRIELRSTCNPFKGKKNILTPHQRRKKQRLIKYVKSKK